MPSSHPPFIVSCSIQHFLAGHGRTKPIVAHYSIPLDNVVMYYSIESECERQLTRVRKRISNNIDHCGWHASLLMLLTKMWIASVVLRKMMLKLTTVI